MSPLLKEGSVFENALLHNKKASDAKKSMNIELRFIEGQ